MRSQSLLWILSLMTALVFSTRLISQAVPQSVPSSKRRSALNYAHLPLTFERNQGQTDAQVKFIARGTGYSTFLTSGGIVLSLRPAGGTSPRLAGGRSPKAANTTLQFKLLGAVQNPVVVGEDPQPGRVNYFIGRDPTKWQRNVPTYSKVRYKNVYAGIDLVYYGNHQQLEYDFAISPGADPGQIKFQIEGPKQIRIDAAGDLVLGTASGTLRFQTPVVYQELGGVRVPVKGSYVLRDSSHVAFRLAHYDSGKTLVIDPVLVCSTYLGGSGNDQPAGIAVDASGSVYIAGTTDSTDFPLTTLGSLPISAPHVFVAKLDPSGSNLVYADYIGGNSQDFGYALALDSNKEVYVTGSTASSDFPVVKPYQGSYPGSFNAFLTKISADGASLLYSTYLGGNGSDVPAGIAIDRLGSVVVAGNTTSTTFPTANAYQVSASPNQGGLYGNYGFLTKFSPDGSSLIYSTYLAGNSNVAYNCGGTPCWSSPYSAINGVAIDGNGNAYTTGDTNTYNFPTTSGAYQATNSTQQNSNIGFVSKFDGSGNLDYSTLFYEASGSFTNLNAIAVDGSGSAYVTGVALSDGTFPVTSTSICDPGVYGFGCDFAFVTKFDAAGAVLAYSTFLGPNNGAKPQAIALDANNDAYVLSSTTSNSFTTFNGIEPYTNESDLLLVEIDPLAGTQLFATYLGASGNEFPAGMALDSNDNLYIAGSTDSSDLPITPGAFQNLLSGGPDAFILKIGPGSEPSVAVAPGLLQFPVQAVGVAGQPQTLLLRNMGSASLSITSITTTGDFAETDDCSTGVPAAGSCTFSVTFTPTAPGVRSGAVVIQDDAAGSPHKINLSGTGFGQGASLAPTSLTFQSLPITTPSTAQTVTLTNSGNAPLAISSVQVTGDYAQTNNCSAPLAASSSCAINITFTPTVSGTRSGTLIVSDSAANSPQTENLTGNGSDFIVASSSGSDKITAGSAATYNLTVSPVGGSFANTVELSCSGLPAQTSCSLSPNAVTPGGSTATSTLSITTTASVAQAESTRTARRAPIYAVWVQLQAAGLLGVLFATPKRRTKKTRAIVLRLLLSGALVFMIGCGGTGILPTPQTGTTPGTYTITIAGTSGSLHHSIPLTLTIQ